MFRPTHCARGRRIAKRPADRAVALRAFDGHQVFHRLPGVTTLRFRSRAFRLPLPHAIHEVADPAGTPLLDKPVDVGVEAGELRVELAGEFEVLDDCPVEPLKMSIVVRRSYPRMPMTQALLRDALRKPL